MEQNKKHRLTKVAKEFGIGVSSLLEYFKEIGISNLTPNSKIDEELYNKALKKYGSEKILREKIKEQAEKVANLEKKTVSIEDIENKETIENKDEIIIKKQDIEQKTKKKSPERKLTDKKSTSETQTKQEKPLIEGPKIVGKIDISDVSKNKTQEKKTTAEKQKTEKQEQITDTQEKKTTTEKQKTEKQEQITDTQEKKTTTEKQKNEQQEEITTTQEKKITAEKQKTEKQEQITKTQEKKITIEKQENKIEEKKNLTSESPKITGPKIVGKIDLDSMNLKTRPDRKTKKEKEEERKKKQKEREQLKKKTQSHDTHRNDKKKRKRIQKVDINSNTTSRKPTVGKKRHTTKKKKPIVITDAADVQKQVKETLQKLEQKQKSQAAKFRREKRKEIQKKINAEAEKQKKESKILKITEFITVKELASLMEVSPTEVINVCFDMGQPVTINFRLDSELINLISDEFGFQVEYVESSFEEEIEQLIKDENNQKEPRPPIVTVMGHVDHGKTSLLDYIRNTNVVSQESGGITQHIGAYSVKLEENKIITFIDTPGHEAFTAMRARGTKVTDIAIIIIAADDNVMPQTEEAIDHARAANVPMIFAINKIDKPGADPEKIKQQLAERNILVEDWGGKYGCVEISAKKGIGIDELLERIWLEAEMLELKANPNRNAIATVLEARLDKGRGYITNIIVRTGTLKVGDIVVAGAYHGKVKAIYNEFNKKLKQIGPSFPAQILGLNGAPEPGEPMIAMDTEKEAREKAEQRMQIIREMELRAKKKHSLEEISRRFAEGEKTDINFIVKADVKGSVDAIVDQITRLSNDEVSVNVVRSAVGQISDTDIMLAAASKSVIIGFNVRPSANARKLAEDKNVEIRLYSIIYDILNDIKAAVQGLLKPEIKEEITGSAEVLSTFKVSKVGTIAGCIVRDGKITQNSKARLIRDGVVVYTGKLNSLKRYKDDVKEVQKGYECGIGIENFNDIKVGDFIETYIETEVERKL